MFLNFRTTSSYTFSAVTLSGFIALTALANASNALAVKSSGPFTIKWRDMPVQAGQSCEEAALDLANRLAATAGQTVAGFEVVESRCVGDDGSHLPRSGSWTIEVTYNASERLPRVNTSDDTASLYRPAFKDAEKCAAALTNETPVFERQTGLQVFVSYCKVPTFASNGWEAVIEGFGKPANRPFTNNVPVFGTVLGHDLGSFRQMLNEGFARFGAELAQAEISSQMAYTELIVRYYGPEWLHPHGHEAANAPTKESCVAEVAGVQSAFASNGVPVMGAFCWENRMNGTAMLEIITNGEEALRFASPEDNYETWEACLAAKDGIADLYRTRYKHQVITALCHHDPREKTTKVKLLEKPRA